MVRVNRLVFMPVQYARPLEFNNDGFCTLRYAIAARRGAITNSVVKYQIEPCEGDASTHGHQDQSGVPGFLAASGFRICADIDSAKRIGGYAYG